MSKELKNLMSSKSAETWPEVTVRELVELLRKKLEAALGTQLEVDPETVDAASGDIMATYLSRPACDAFELVFLVRLHVAVGSASSPTVGATVFPFSRGARLRVKGADLLDFTLDPSLGDEAGWHC